MSPDQKILKLLEAISQHPALKEIAKSAGLSREQANALLNQLKSAMEHRTKQAILIIDGASKGNPGPSGAGIILRDPGGREIKALSIPLGIKTNNEAEYLALLEGLTLAKEIGFESIRVMSDSELLIRQMNGDYQIKNKKILKLAIQAKRLCEEFSEVIFEKAPRSITKRADGLARTASHKSEAMMEEP